MNQLKQVIDQNYSTLPKSQAAQITIDVCNQQMNEISKLLEQNENDTINLRKAKLYTIISDGILELRNEERDLSKIDFAKLHIPLLLEIIESENLSLLENSNSNIQEKIINEILIPNYLLEWSLNNL